MKVEGRLQDASFSDIKCGQAFVFEGKPYMKTAIGEEDSESADNSVNLESGHTRRIAKNRKVEPKPHATIKLD